MQGFGAGLPWGCVQSLPRISSSGNSFTELTTFMLVIQFAEVPSVSLVRSLGLHRSVRDDWDALALPDPGGLRLLDHSLRHLLSLLNLPSLPSFLCLFGLLGISSFFHLGHLLFPRRGNLVRLVIPPDFAWLCQHPLTLNAPSK